MAKNKNISWFKIILWLIFFYPVGFYLIFKKLTSRKEIKEDFNKYVVINSYNYYNNDKKDSKETSRTEYEEEHIEDKEDSNYLSLIKNKLNKMEKDIKSRKHLGFILVGLGSLYFISTLSYFKFSSIFISFLFISAGILVISLTKNKSEIISLANKYLRILDDMKSPYIKEIAAACQTSPEISSSELQYLIDVNILEASYIDYDKKIIHTPLINKAIYSETQNKDSRKKIIECKYCGGVNEIVDDNYICQFCGSPLRE